MARDIRHQGEALYCICSCAECSHILEYRSLLKLKFRYIRVKISRELIRFTDSSSLESVIELDLQGELSVRQFDFVLEQLKNVEHLRLFKSWYRWPLEQSITTPLANRQLKSLELVGDMQRIGIPNYIIDRLPAQRLKLTLSGLYLEHFRSEKLQQWLKDYLTRHQTTVEIFAIGMQLIEPFSEDMYTISIILKQIIELYALNVQNFKLVHASPYCSVWSRHERQFEYRQSCNNSWKSI